MALRHAAEIERALTDALKNGTRSQKIRASESLLKLALAAERLDAFEHRDERQHMDREQLIAVLGVL